MADRPQPSNVLWAQVPPLELLESPDHLDSPNDTETIDYSEPERDTMGEQPDRAYTLDEVSAVLDKKVTKERVRQIEASALNKFRRNWRNMVGYPISAVEAVSLIYQATAYEAAKGEVECKR